MRRLGAALFILGAVACKTGQNPGGAGVKDIQSEEKITLVQSSDGSGTIALITCKTGWTDKQAKSDKFAVPWNKVENLTYPQLELIYCTEPAGGSVVITNPPGGGTSNPPPGGGGTPSGDFTPLNTDQCKSAENINLPGVAEVKRVFVASAVGETYDRCVIFGDQLETILSKVPVLKKKLIEKKTRIYAQVNGALSYDALNNKLFVSLNVKEQGPKILETFLGFGMMPKLNAPFFFPVNTDLVWQMVAGPHGPNESQTACAALGPEWKMPTFAQVTTVAASMTEQVMKDLAPNTPTTNQFYVVPDNSNVCVSVPANSPAGCSATDKVAVCVMNLAAGPT